MGRLEALLLGPIRIRRALGSAAAAYSTVLGSAAVTAAQFTVGGLWALTSLYIVRSLTAHEYGRLAFGIFIYTLMQAVAGLGLATSVMAEIARGRRSNNVSWPTVRALLWLRLGSTAPLLLIGFGWAATSHNILPAMASVIGSIGIVAEFLIGVLAGGLRTRAYIVVILAQPATFAFLLVVLQIRTAEIGFTALGSALALSLLLAVAFLGPRGVHRVGRPQVSFAILGHAVGTARTAYLIYSLHIGFISIPIILLGVLGRYAEGAALSIVLTLIRFVPEALGLAVMSTYFPRLKGVDPDGPEARALFATFARLLAVLAIPAAVGLAVTGRQVLAVLFGGNYDDLAPYLAIGSVLVVLLPAESLLTWTLVARNDGRTAILAIGIRLGLVLAACLAFVLVDGQDPLRLVLMACAVGVMMSVAIQGLRAYRSDSLARPGAAIAAFAALTGGTYVVVRAMLPGDASDIAIVIAAGLTTVPLLAAGAWILRGRATREGGGAP